MESSNSADTVFLRTRRMPFVEEDSSFLHENLFDWRGFGRKGGFRAYLTFPLAN